MNISKKFQRKSSAEFAQETAVPLGWFVLPSWMVDEKHQRRRLYGKWCRLKTDQGVVYRVIRFSPRLKSKDEPADIVLDWAAWLELNGHDEDVQQPIKITITEADPLQIVRAAVHHPEPGYRIASWLALISVGMGLLSFALGVLALL